MKTTKACRAVLNDIRSSISKATRRVATDPDYLDRVVEMSQRECAAYGLTEADLGLFALRVGQGTTELRLQKEGLLQQMASLKSSARDSTGIGSDADVRQRDRELSILAMHLEHIKLAMSTIKDLDQRPHKVSDFADAHHIDLDHDQTWSDVDQGIIPGLPELRRKTSYTRSRAKEQDSEVTRIGSLEESRVSSIASEHERRNVGMQTTSTRGPAREVKQLADRSKAKSDIKRSDHVEKSIGSAATAPNSRSRDASVYIALQHEGFVQATSTRGSTRMWVDPASQEELSQLVIQQRSQGKDFSTLTNYRLLNHDIQDRVYSYLEKLLRDRPDLEWTIHSIDIRKGKRTHLSRFRRQKSEHA
ncbi:MAG: hypothetical protein Q9212_005228 [Teloschistes hypoglaucus]